MRRTLAVLGIMLVSVTAIADGWSDLHGIDKNGYTVDLYPASLDTGVIDWREADRSEPFNILYYKAPLKDVNNAKTYTGQRCSLITDKNGEPISFVCEASGKTLLSGVTYTIKRNKDSRDCSYEYLYKCIKGCENPLVPKQMTKSYWECE